MKKSMAVIAAAFTMLFSIPTMAGWELGTDQNADRWKYKLDEEIYGSGSYASGWKWIDGNNDGVYEHYRFDDEGWMLSNTYTPDSQYVNGDGAREVNGQTVTIDTRSLPAAPYASLYEPKENIFSYINFSIDDLVDHGDYYELKNQHIYKEVPNEYYFDYETVYDGSIYFYKDIVYSNTYLNQFLTWSDALASFPNSEYDYAHDGIYRWTLFDMDAKGYYTGFTVMQLP